MKPPKLIISVSGDAKEDINKNIKNVFHKGLAKLAISTNAWITTGGSYSGIMKTVGQSVGDKSFFAKQNIVLLGIANWTTIAYRNELIRKNVIYIVVFFCFSKFLNIKTIYFLFAFK